MKIIYKKAFQIIDCEFCCDKTREKYSDMVIITPEFINNIVDKCPFCNAKIELQEVT